MSVNVPQEWRPIPRSILPTSLEISSMKTSEFEVVNVNCFTRMLLNSASSALFFRISEKEFFRVICGWKTVINSVLRNCKDLYFLKLNKNAFS